MRAMKDFIRDWMHRTVTVKWAVLSYSVLLGFTWVAFSAVAYQNNINEDSIREITTSELAGYRDRIEYDRCVAGFAADQSSRDALLFVVASANVDPDFQAEVVKYIETNLPTVPLDELCGEPPPPLALGRGQGRGEGD